MKWHYTREEQQRKQKDDEGYFERIFREDGFTIEKLDIENPDKSPDYRITKNKIEVIIELKSRFENQRYNLIASLFTSKLDKLPFSYDYRFQHEYSEIPDNDIIKQKINQIRHELSGLSENTQLPYSLKSGRALRLYLPSDHFKIDPAKSGFTDREIKNNFKISNDCNVNITLDRKNSKGCLNCWMLIGNNESINLLEENKRYFSRSINYAKKQLSTFLYKKVIGIVFVNNTPLSWDDYNILSLYGDLKVAFSRSPKDNIATPFLGDNRLIRETKKQWLSFIGFIQPGINDELQIYLNDFAEKRIDGTYLDLTNFSVKTVKLSDDGNDIIIV